MGHYDSDYEFDEQQRRNSKRYKEIEKKIKSIRNDVISPHSSVGDLYDKFKELERLENLL